MNHVPPGSESQNNSRSHHDFNNPYNIPTMSSGEQTGPHLQHVDFNDSIYTSYRQYDINNLNLPPQSIPVHYNNSSQSTQEFYYRVQLVTIYNSNGSSRQIANTSLRIKVDPSLNVFWTVFTTDRTPPISFFDTSYVVSKTRLLLHFTPRRTDYENYFDCLFPSMNEINNCFNAYKHFEGLAQAYQSTHNQFSNSLSLPYAISTHLLDQSQQIPYQFETSHPPTLSLHSSTNTPNFFDIRAQLNRNTALVPGSSSQHTNNALVTTLKYSSKSPALSQPFKKELLVDNSFPRANSTSKTSIDLVNTNLQLTETARLDQRPATSRPTKTVRDFSKNNNLQSLDATTSKNLRQSLEFLARNGSPALSNESSGGKSSKTKPWSRKTDLSSTSSLTQKTQEVGKTLGIVSDHQIVDLNQPKTDAHEAKRTTVTEKSSKKRKLSGTTSNTSRSNKRNEGSQKGALNSLIDKFANSTDNNNNAHSNRASSSDSSSLKLAVSAGASTGPDTKISNIAIKGSSVRLADELKMQARLDRFKPQSSLTTKNCSVTNPQNLVFLGASTKSQINSTTRPDVSSQTKSLSTDYSPNFPVDQASINYGQQIGVSQVSQPNLIPPCSDAAFSLLSLNKTLDKSSLIASDSFQKTNDSISASEKVSESTTALFLPATSKMLTAPKAILEPSADLKPSKAIKAKQKPAPPKKASKVVFKSHDTGPKANSSAFEQDSRNTSLTDTKKKNTLNSVNTTQQSTLATRKESGSTSELTVKKPSVSVEKKSLTSNGTVKDLNKSLGSPVTAPLSITEGVKLETKSTVNKNLDQEISKNKSSTIKTEVLQTPVQSQNPPNIETGVFSDEKQSLVVTLKLSRKRAITPPRNTRELRKRKSISYAETSNGKISKSQLKIPLPRKSKSATSATETIEKTDLTELKTKPLPEETVADSIKPVKLTIKEPVEDTQQPATVPAVMEDDKSLAEQKKPVSIVKAAKPNTKSKVNQKGKSKSKAKAKNEKITEPELVDPAFVQRRPSKSNTSKQKTNKNFPVEPLLRLTRSRTSKLASAISTTSNEPALTSIVASALPTENTAFKITYQPTGEASSVTDNLPAPTVSIKTMTEPVPTMDEPLNLTTLPTADETVTVIQTPSKPDIEQHTDKDIEQSKTANNDSIVNLEKKPKLAKSDSVKNNTEDEFLASNDSSTAIEHIDAENCVPTIQFNNKAILGSHSDVKSETAVDIESFSPVSKMSMSGVLILDPKSDIANVQRQSTAQKSDVIKSDLNEVNHSYTKQDLLIAVSKSEDIPMHSTSEIKQDFNGLESSQPESNANTIEYNSSTKILKAEPEIGTTMVDTNLKDIHKFSMTSDLTCPESSTDKSLLTSSSGIIVPLQSTEIDDSKPKPNLSVTELGGAQPNNGVLIPVLFVPDTEVKPENTKSDVLVTQLKPNFSEPQSKILTSTLEPKIEVGTISTVSEHPTVSNGLNLSTDSKSLDQSESFAVKTPYRISVREAMLKALPASAMNRKQSYRKFSLNKTQSDNASASTTPPLTNTAAVTTLATLLATSSPKASDFSSSSSSPNLPAGSFSEVLESTVKAELSVPISETLTTSDKPKISPEIKKLSKSVSLDVLPTSVISDNSTVVKDSNIEQPPHVVLLSSENASDNRAEIKNTAELDQKTDTKPSESFQVVATKRAPKPSKKTSTVKRKTSIKKPILSDPLPPTVKAGDVSEFNEKPTSTVFSSLPAQDTMPAKVPPKKPKATARNSLAKKSTSTKLVKSLPNRTGLETSNYHDNVVKYGAPPKKNSRPTHKLDELTVLRTLRNTSKPEALPLPVVFTPSSEITEDRMKELKTVTKGEFSKSTDQSLVNPSSLPTASVNIGIASLSIFDAGKYTEKLSVEKSQPHFEKIDSDLTKDESLSPKHGIENNKAASDVSVFSDVSDRVNQLSFKDNKSDVLNSSETLNPDLGVSLKLNLLPRASRRPTALEQLEMTEALKRTSQPLNDVLSSPLEPAFKDSQSGTFNQDEVRSKVERFITLTSQELDLVPDVVKSLERLDTSEKRDVVGSEFNAMPERHKVSVKDDVNPAAVPFDATGIVSAQKQTSETKASKVSPPKLIKNVIDEVLLERSPSPVHEVVVKSSPKIVDDKDYIENSAQTDKRGEQLILRRPPSTRLRKLRSDTVLQNQYHQLFNTPFQFVFDDNKRHDITTDDFIKLNEGEYLNDTLINFYLKYHHQLTTKTDEDVAKLVYIFNTFFYEKLARKDKNGNIGYDFVKTWTTKVDLFKMKYVIVPINMKMHWYLAIIYNLPALLKEKVTENTDGKSKPSQEKSSECFDGEPDKPPTDQPIKSDSKLKAAESTAPQLENAELGADAPIVSETRETTTTGSQNQVLQRVTRKGAHSFTKKSSRESTLKAARSHKISVEDDCVIFILDSFKSRNYAVLSRNLKDYICKEAFDKLNITVDKQRIITKQVDVPQQNNFCDCGVYLIHYVERFLLDPARIVELMAKVMKNMETNNREIVNELLRLWDTSMISKKRGKLKSEIVMCKTKQDKERDAEREPSNQQQQQQQQREQNERQDPQELQKQQSQDQQPESQPQTSSLQGQPSATPSQNNSDEASSYGMSLDAVDIEIGNSSNSIVQEKIPNDDDDEDEVVVVDVMKKSRRGPRRGKR